RVVKYLINCGSDQRGILVPEAGEFRVQARQLCSNFLDVLSPGRECRKVHVNTGHHARDIGQPVLQKGTHTRELEDGESSVTGWCKMRAHIPKKTLRLGVDCCYIVAGV